jgi:hypothetical protein
VILAESDDAVLPRNGLLSTYATIFAGILPFSAFLKISRQKAKI